MNPGGSQRHGRSHDEGIKWVWKQGHQGEQERRRKAGVRTQTGYEEALEKEVSQKKGVTEEASDYKMGEMES